jgi:hypothetical protein
MRLNALWFATVASAIHLPSFPAQINSTNAGRELTSSYGHGFTAAPTTTLRVVPSSGHSVDGSVVRDEIIDPESDEDNCPVQFEALKMLYTMKVDEARNLEEEIDRLEKLYAAEKAKSAETNKLYQTCNNERKTWASQLDRAKKELAEERQHLGQVRESCLRDIVKVEDEMRQLSKKTKQLQEEVETGPGPFPCNPEELLCRGERSPVCRQMGCCN